LGIGFFPRGWTRFTRPPRGSMEQGHYSVLYKVINDFPSLTRTFPWFYTAPLL
jgi:hypothetical protein